MRADFLGVREGNHAALSSGCCIRTAPTTEPRPFGPYCRLPHGTATVPVAGKLGLCDGKKVHLRRWLRYDGRVGSWLALFALTIQLTVSFGHVHLEGVARTDPALLTLAEAMQASQSLFAHPPGTAGGDDDYCPICASVYLTGNSFIPAAPVLSLPSASTAVEHFKRHVPVFFAPRRLAFQSRAPPLA